MDKLRHRVYTTAKVVNVPLPPPADVQIEIPEEIELLENSESLSAMDEEATVRLFPVSQDVTDVVALLPNAGAPAADC